MYAHSVKNYGAYKTYDVLMSMVDKFSLKIFAFLLE